MADPDAIAIETDPKQILLVCPECGDDFASNQKLGYHRRMVHNVAGKFSGKGKRPAGAPRPAAIEVIKSMADDAGAGRSRGTPTESDLTKAMARAIGAASFAAASYAVETDERLKAASDPIKEQTVDYLALSTRASIDIAEPLGRAFAHSPLNKRYGRAVVDNIDVVGSLAELTILTMHWRRYLSERHAWEREMRAGGQAPSSFATPQYSAVPSAANGMPAPVGQRDGKVLTKEDIDKMRAGQN